MKDLIKTRNIIVGAILGYVATGMDEAFKEIGINEPIGSFIFVVAILIIFVLEYFEKDLKEKTNEKKSK